MHIAYLINQYPKVSHAFIRREILALEQIGLQVDRIALRGWDLELADRDDFLERKRTRYVLQDGALPLIAATARSALTHPVRFIKALALAWRMSRRAERPFPIHLVYLAEACRIESWLRVAGIQHLHAHFGTNAAEVAMFVGVLGNRRWSFTAHGPEEFYKAPIIGLEEKIRRAAFVVAISSFGRSQIYRLSQIEHWPKVHVIHCGVDDAFYATPSPPPPRELRLVCVGRLCAAKGQLLLVEAARRLAADSNDFEIVLAGDGELRTEIEALIAKYGLQGKVRITGWISSEQVRNEIQAARALILPSFAEGLPVVIMEAMALRRPVISTFVAGIPELVRSGEHGWLMPAGDLDELVQVIRTALDTDTETLMRMGEAGHSRVMARHNVGVEAAKLAELFHRAAKHETT